MAARDEIAGTLKAMRKQAHDTAKTEATKRAIALQAKIESRLLVPPETVKPKKWLLMCQRTARHCCTS